MLAFFATFAPTGLGAQEQTAAEPLELYHEIHGEGPPLVLLHEAFMTIDSNWRSSLAELGKSNKVIAVELQGHGRTPDRDAPLSYETMADDVAHLLETLDVQKASLLGYSMGANVALQLALRHPDKVARLVAVSPSASDTGLAPGHKEMVRHLSPETFAGSPVAADYDRLSPRPDFPALAEKIKQM